MATDPADATGTAPVRSIRLTPRSLQTLAHPLRSRLLGALRRHGAATATELAAQLDTNSGATSYHLRQLEAVGLVRDTGEGQGRRRVWAAASEMHGWERSDFAGDPDSDAALNWLVRHYLHELAGRYESWLDVESAWPMAWRDAAGMGDYLVNVTADQLAALQRELTAVLERYAHAGDGEPGARPVVVAYLGFPQEPTAVPEGDGGDQGAGDTQDTGDAEDTGDADRA